MAPRLKDTASGLVRLALDTRRHAWLSVPRCASGPRPIAIYAHGSGGNAYDACVDGREMFADRGFVICPYGVPNPYGGETFRNYSSFVAELEEGLDRLSSVYAGYVDLERPVLIGASLGANLAAMLAIHQPARFPRLFLVEGGNSLWTGATARQFSQQGGERLLFGCGTDSCREQVEARRSALADGLAVRFFFAEGAGHSFRAVRAQMGREVEWLVADDARWSLVSHD